MKFSENWLREWVNPDISRDELVEQLTMAGHELDGMLPVAAAFNNIIVGEILSVEKHPDADKLSICQVNVGQQMPIQIVCGAKNVKANSKVPVALVGAVINNDFKIKKSKLRGVPSNGMICSEKELGLAESSIGIMVLAKDAPVGVDIRQYLQLNDVTIALDLTPNRGDCLSIVGIARELAVLNDITINPPKIAAVSPTIDDTMAVELSAVADCPHYVGRIIKNINPKAQSPLWLTEKLRRCEIRCIHPVVDVTNYVMLELGQPLHAFDFHKLHGSIVVRKAKAQESLTLLDEQTLTVDEQTVVIADDKQAIALAGIMGGLDSSVTDKTTDIFLESAFFTPHKLSGRARQYGLHTDSSHRYERGVDIALQVQAIERASALLLEIVGGQAGPLTEKTIPEFIPDPDYIHLRRERIPRILGVSVSDEKIQSVLSALGMRLTSVPGGWEVKVPSFRFDITIEADLIEEIGRIYGYNKIPARSPQGSLRLSPSPETVISSRRFKQLLVGRDYQESINYSFVDPKIQALLSPDYQAIRLENPMSQELSEMRTSLLPGLVSAVIYNQNRQQPRIKLFEIGNCFIMSNEGLLQQSAIAGVCSGNAYPSQWGLPARDVDFYDIKSDIEALLKLTNKYAEIHFEPIEHPVLHPGQGARITYRGKLLGLVGMIHPQIAQNIGAQSVIYGFELDFQQLEKAVLPKFAKLSKYPAIKRDIAVIVDNDVTAASLIKTIKSVAGPLVVDLGLFDVYTGPGVPENKKSIAIDLVMQHNDRTLIDDEVDTVFTEIVDALEKYHRATLRK